MKGNQGPKRVNGVKGGKGVPGDKSGVRMVDRERVARARREGLKERELTRLAQLYRAFADPSRLKILHALLAGEMCVCDLAAFLERGESAASHQLRLLRTLGLVQAGRRGQIIYYRLNSRGAARLLKVGLDQIREE